MSTTTWDLVKASPVPGLVLRALPGVLVVISLLTSSGQRHRLPLPIVVALGVVVVLSNVLLLGPRYGEPLARQTSIALLVFVTAGSILYFALPESVLIVLPYWAARVAVRYHQAGRAELVVVALGLLGAGVPIYINTHSTPAALGAVLGLTALVLASINRQRREEQLEGMEVSLARKQAAIEEHSRAAALAERARIARDVHDVLAHSLAGLSLSLQGARLMLVRDGASSEAIEQVTRAQGLAAEGLAEARRAVAALREDAVPDVRALGDLVTSYRLESRATADFEVEGEARALPAEVMSTLYRTVQEALANTRKHAPGAPVLVRLCFADEIRLTIEDRPGRRPGRPTPGGYGLLGMRERADLIGGSLETGPTSDGWRVELKVPV